MKIGILTIYSVDFGSFFQAISLYFAIKKMGYDCEIINDNLREKVSIKAKLAYLVFRFAPKSVIKLLSEMQYLFKKYVLLKNDIKDIDLKISKRYSSWNQLDKNYDLIIVGSDEIWSYTNKTMMYIPGYFGHGYSCPHISYAVSAASLKLSTSDKRYYEFQEGLKTFSSIGVRDRKTRDIVKRLIGVESEIVVDPTLLNPFFLKKVHRRIDESDYILVYGQHFNKSFIRAIRKFARESNLKILSISWNHNWCDEFVDIKSAFELQDYYRGCSYCATSTFHGTVFAMLHNKQFFVQLTRMRGVKIKQLLESFDLLGRVYSKSIGLKNMKKVNYGRVNRILEKERKKSYLYLKSAINKVKKYS